MTDPITLFAIGSCAMVPFLALALVSARRQVRACHERIATRDARIAADRARICELSIDLDRLSAPQSEPPLGIVGATVTSRPQRRGLRDLLARASQAPWRRTIDHDDDYQIFGAGDPLPHICYVPNVDEARDDADSDLICAARNVLPDLLADVESLLADVASLQVAHAQTVVERDALRARLEVAA